MTTSFAGISTLCQHTHYTTPSNLSVPCSRYEHLAYGRRHMPFGYEPGEPFGADRGYLMPGEVWQLATILRDVKPPGQSEVEKDYKSFYEQQMAGDDTFHLIDEALPTNAHEFLKAVRRAALQGFGLICSVG